MKKWLFAMTAAVVMVTGCSSEPASATTEPTTTAASATEAPETEAVTEETPTEAAPAELFEASVKDAVFAEEDEICPLVSLTEDDPMTSWDDQGRVLMVTWHNYPDSYPEGEEVVLSWGTVWTFTDKEFIHKYETEVKDAEDQEMRLKQLIGFAPDSEHSTFTGFWVDPEDVVRPAYQPDPTDETMLTELPEETDEAFKAWFDDNILGSYFYGDYPWTRLGYSYDWADNGNEYGFTEFLVKQDTEVEVAFTMTTEEYLEQMETE